MKVIAKTRKVQGTSASRRLRRENKVPGILYGNNVAATPIEIDHKELFYDLQKEKFHASILTMELDGADQLVVLRSFQMHPYKNQCMHVDFQRIDPNSDVTMRVPLHFFGEEQSPAVKIEKAFVSHIVSTVDLTCLPKDLPEFIDVDLSGMTTGFTMRVADLKLPEHVKAVNPDQPVATVTTIADDTPAAAATAATDAAAPAAGAAPATAAAPAADAAPAAAPAKDSKK